MLHGACFDSRQCDWIGWRLDTKAVRSSGTECARASVGMEPSTKAAQALNN
jgi:hypothetical protein